MSEMKFRKAIGYFQIFFAVFWFAAGTARGQMSQTIDLAAYHHISSHELLDYAAKLSSEEFGGRLSGSPGYEAAARWVAAQLEEWGLKPGMGDSSYFQWFPNAWTDVLTPGTVKLIADPNSHQPDKVLSFPDDFFPGSNSASGTIEGEVVYAGFGITAPELGYNDYSGMDVNGKIVLIEPGIPYTQNDPEMAKWEPYSYHRYKFQRAKELGAIGLLYVGLTANPNTSWLENFIYAHISEAVADELLARTGRKFQELKPEIIKTMAPVSFPTNRRVSISASTKHFPESRSCNVVGIIEGSDPQLKHEAIIIGAHLDGIGSPGMLFPGALDNASGVAGLLGAAKALASSAIKPDRSVVFVFFGGEECGLYGSKAFIEHEIWPKENTLFMINLDMVGNGTGFHVSGGLSHPGLYKHFELACQKYLHRELRSSEIRPSYGRPRTDAAVFEKAGYKTLQLWTTGTVKKVYYHHPLDNIDGLTPEIMEDAAKLLYISILGAANDKNP